MALTEEMCLDAGDVEVVEFGRHIIRGDGQLSEVVVECARDVRVAAVLNDQTNRQRLRVQAAILAHSVDKVHRACASIRVFTRGKACRVVNTAKYIAPAQLGICVAIMVLVWRYVENQHALYRLTISLKIGIHRRQAGCEGHLHKGETQGISNSARQYPAG